tara:strand:+ start:782 stop:1453 length:672 start_codon:yes stop_codon:yes gene_type:complete
MDVLLKKINELNKNEEFSENIKESDFIQTIKMNNGENMKLKNVIDLILLKYNPTLSFGDMNKLEIEQEKVKLVEDLENIYDSYNFNNRVLSIKKIQNGFQEMNSMSSIYFLSEYYKINFCFCNNNEIMFTNYKDYEKDYILINDNYFSFTEELKSSKYLNIYNCDIFKNDMISDNIYKSNLKPISKYKLSELKELASKLGINGKLNKKDLYLEIYKLNLNNID